MYTFGQWIKIYRHLTMGGYPTKACPQQLSKLLTNTINTLLLLNACVRVADVMIFTFVSLTPVHNVCRVCMIIKQ